MEKATYQGDGKSRYVLWPTQRTAVLPGEIPGSRLKDLRKAWNRIREKAELPDLRLHDLRHNFGSIAAELNMPPSTIANILGHKQVATTERYAHVGESPAREAAERIGDELEGRLGGS